MGYHLVGDVQHLLIVKIVIAIGGRGGRLGLLRECI